MVLVGFELEKRAYRCYDEAQGKVVISRDVVIDETAVLDRTAEIIIPQIATSEAGKSESISIELVGAATKSSPETSKGDIVQPTVRKSERLENMEKPIYKSLLSVG